MALTVQPFELPADAAEVRAGDADGDGRDELVIVSRTSRAGAPAAVKLTILHFGENGALGGRRVVDLGARATLWDIDHGLWTVDKDGLSRVDPTTGQSTRLARLPTPLAAIGPTTPAWAPIAHDLDGDGRPELILWSGGRYHAFRNDGTAFGSVAAPAEGALDVDWEVGGGRQRVTVTPPPLAVADLDGDGRRDLVMPSGATLAAYYTGDTVGARAATIPLPIDLEPVEESPRPGETRRRITGVWIDDIDGDRKIDLAVQRIVLAGSWWGATAELSWAKGRGDSFAALTTLSLGAAAFGVELVDFDGDGDKDFVAPVADVNIGTIARALVARSARVDLSMYRFGGGQFAPAKLLRQFGYPLEQPDRFQAALDADVDGDKRIDLVTNDAEDRVRVYRGVGDGLATTASWDTPVRVPVADETLFVHDLTGDGRAEIVVWGPKEKTGTLLRVP